MRKERQRELLERVAASGEGMRGLHAPASMVNPASVYTDEERFAREQRLLFREGPVFFAMSCELPEPGSYHAARIAGVPVVVIRQADGSLRALVNICRHRGAPVMESGTSGTGLRALVCPYHSWTYDIDGKLLGRPQSEGAFEDVRADCDLHPLAVAERYGMVFVRAGGREPIDVDEFLGGAADDLGAFGLDRYVHIESRTNTWNMNWKLVLDTFTEAYHIRTVHKDTIAPMFSSDCILSESFGRHVMSVGLRKNILDELAKPKDEWSLLPYGTIQYFLVPNALVVHQLDHVEAWRLDPIGVGRTAATTSIYAPVQPQNEKEHRYFVKNLDLLLKVTETEDFPLMERIQANLASGALPELVYGRNEPPLILFHRSVNAALDGDEAKEACRE